MLYVSEYCIAAVMGTAVLFATYFLKRNYDTLHNRLFLCMILINLLSSALNIVSIGTISSPANYSPFVRLAVNLGYLWLYNLLAGVFLLYTDNVTKIPRIKIPVRIILLSIHLLETFLIFTSPFTNWIAYFDGNLAYRRGIFHPLLYVISYVEIFCCLILFTICRRRFNQHQKIAVSCFAVGNVAAQIFQLLFPRYVICNFVNTLSLFFLFIAFENQAYYLFQTTQCYNRYSFVTTVRWLQKRETPYRIIALRMEYIQTASVAARPSTIDQLTIRLAERLYRAFPGQVYVLSDECFAIIEESESCQWDETATDRIRACFATPVTITQEKKTESTLISPLIQTITVKDFFPNGYALLDYLSGADNFSRAAMSDEDVDAAVESMRREQKMLHLIDQALEKRAFRVWYQPILDAARGEYHSAEALLRLDDRDGGFVNPEELIRIAEKNGRIDAVGLYVFEEVCRMIRDRGIRQLGVSSIEVNLSPRQLRDPKLADSLLELIRKYGLSPDSFNLEITETAEITPAEKAQMDAFMERMGAEGVTFSLDDYGSGFATIGTLLNYPVDIVKFDKEILWKAMRDPAAMTILQTSLSAVRGIGKKALVEGVETPEMEKMLRESCCDYMQGFLFSRPLPEAEFEGFIREHPAGGNAAGQPPADKN